MNKNDRRSPIGVYSTGIWVRNGLICSTVLALTSTAHAASATVGVSAEPTAGTLEEVVVTARKREENLQRAPLAISAFTSNDLSQHSAVNLPDVAQFTPSLSFATTSFDPFSSYITLRGQGTADVLLESEPPISIYVDGVYVSGTLASNVQSLLGVERIEVLKGPQGTLYGRNTTGGAISVVTALPNYDGFSGEARVRYGNFQTIEASTQVNLPIISNVLSARIGVDYLDQRQGFGRDVTTGGELDNPRSSSVRAALRFDPTADLEFVLRADFTNSHSGASIARLSYVAPGSPATIEAGIEEASVGKLVNPAFSGAFLGALFPVLTGTATPAQFGIFGQGLAQARTDMFNSRPNDVYSSAFTGPPLINPSVNLKTYGESLTGNYEFNDNLSLKSITAGRRLLRDFEIDADGTPFNILTASPQSTTSVSQFTQEFDLSGAAFGNKLKYVAGLYYFYSDGTEVQINLAIPAINPAAPISNRGEVKDTSKAIFGQATYALTDVLNLTAGLRETKENKSLLSQNSSGTGPTLSCGIPPAQQIGGQCLGEFSNSFNSLSYTASLDYSLSESSLVYVRTGKGFKAGGQNERVGLANANFANFGPETATDYEIGIKTDLLDKRLRINADYYHTKYSDIQQTIVVAGPGGVPTTIVANSGDAKIDGLELDVQALPIDALLLRVAGAWTNPKFVTGIPLNSGGRFDNTPRFEGSASAIYSHPTALGLAKLGVDYSWRGLVDFASANHDAFSAPYAQQPAYGLLGARLSLNLKRSDTDVALYGRNLMNRYFYTGAADAAGAGLGTVVQYVGAPRTYGIEISQKF